MATKVAINGFGRIGRLVARAILERDDHDLELVSINDLADTASNALLFGFDSTHGRFPGTVETEGNDLVVNGKRIHVTAEREPGKLPHRENGIDIVLECTGFFATKDKAMAHIEGGAKHVVVSQPAGSDVKTIVYGVNHETLEASDQIVSNASCTTNCLAPVAKALQDTVGIESGLMTTIHAFTNDQVLTDVYHSDLRRARSATQSMIPTKTGAAAAVGLVMPELKGKLDGFAIRVPTINVSIVDLTFKPGRATSADEINQIMKDAATSGPLSAVLNYNDAPLVSIDFNHDAASSTFDAGLTREIDGGLIKVCSWYDNEWGYSNRMLDTTLALAKA